MSLSKNEIKDLRFLQSKRGREDQGLYLVEGPKLIEEAVKSGAKIQTIYSTDESFNLKGDFKLISNKELSQVSLLKTPNKAIATVLMNQPDFTKFQDKKLTLVLDRINDPGNLGTILRIADWFGISQIICSPGSVEHTNPKVVQASMGAVFRVKVYQMEIKEAVEEFKSQFPDGNVLVADMAGESIHESSYADHAMLIMGSESHGIDPSVLDLGVKRIHIPGYGRAESLNVGVATGIICSTILK